MQGFDVGSIHIGPAAELFEAVFGRVGIYARNGTGKTSFLATWPRNKRLWVISAGKENIKPLIGRPNIHVTKITTWAQLLDIYLFLKKALLVNGKPNPKIASGELNFFDGIAFDTWTKMQVLGMEARAGKLPIKEGEEHKYLLNVPSVAKGKGGETFEAYEQAAALSREWMGNFMGLPIHTIFIFQEGVYKPHHDHEKTEVVPALTPQAVRFALEDLEIVGRLYTEFVSSDKPTNGLIDLNAATQPVDPTVIDPNAKVIRRMLLGPHELYRCKGPTHILGYVVENPTWEKLARSLDPNAYEFTPAELIEVPAATPAAPATQEPTTLALN